MCKETMVYIKPIPNYGKVNNYGRGKTFTIFLNLNMET